MATMRHWTEESVDDYLHRLGEDFVRQIETAMNGASQAKLAKDLGVSEGRVSQVLNNPGNLTLKKMIQYARALERKVTVVCYDDGDSENNNGPVNSEIFLSCWEAAGKPTDFFMLQDHSVDNSGYLRFPSSGPDAQYLDTWDNFTETWTRADQEGGSHVAANTVRL